MKQIQGKSVLLQGGRKFELPRFQVIGVQLYLKSSEVTSTQITVFVQRAKPEYQVKNLLQQSRETACTTLSPELNFKQNFRRVVLSHLPA